MLAPTILDIPPQEQQQMLSALRRARYGSLLALHILLLGAAGRQPTEIATCLMCSRSSVYRTMRLSRVGELGWSMEATGRLGAPVRSPVLLPWMRRSLSALLKTPPRTSGWCRTRWSGATLAAQLKANHGLEVSAWTSRRWRHAMGWGWKRAKRIAKDDDPERLARLARLRLQAEHVPADEVLGFADELDMPLLPKVGAAWMPKGSPQEAPTPSKHEKHSLAGGLNPATGTLLSGLGSRNTNVFFRQLLALLDRPAPAHGINRIAVVVANYRIHKAKARQKWVADHPPI